MKSFFIRNLMFGCFALLAGCAANPAKTERPDILGEKVTEGRVQAALQRAGQQYDDISVHAVGDQLTLSGEVASAADKQEAEKIARTVHRVHGIDNELQVRGK